MKVLPQCVQLRGPRKDLWMKYGDEPALCLTLYLCESVVFEESTSEQCAVKVTSSTSLVCWCLQAFLSKPVGSSELVSSIIVITLATHRRGSYQGAVACQYRAQGRLASA